MLPLELSAGVLSLEQGALRPALDFSISFDASFRLRGRRVQPRMTRVTRRLTYLEADALLAGAPGDEDGRALTTMLGATEALFQERIARGAFPLRRREYRVRVENQQVQVRTIEPDSPSRKLVAEAMIAACGIAGDYFSANRVPALFRRQDPPAQPVPWSAERSGDPVWVHRQLTTLRRVYGSVEAGRHFSLGSSAYCQITSPLRRYGDLAMQRQLLHHAATGTPYYSANEIWALSQDTEAASKGAASMEANATAYWLHQMLHEQEGQRVPAVVLETRGREMLVQLENCGLKAKITGARPCQEGQVIQVKVVKSRPRSGLLILGY
jgi:exoribonuclease-2